MSCPTAVTYPGTTNEGSAPTLHTPSTRGGRAGRRLGGGGSTLEARRGRGCARVAMEIVTVETARAAIEIVTVETAAAMAATQMAAATVGGGDTNVDVMRRHGAPHSMRHAPRAE